jgi:hypothetical protein
MWPGGHDSVSNISLISTISERCTICIIRTSNQHDLFWPEYPMHVGITSVFWERWKSVLRKIISMIFVQGSDRKHRKLLIIPQITRITMENTLPVKGSITLRLIIFDPRAESMSQKPSFLGSSPHIYAKSCETREKNELSKISIQSKISNLSTRLSWCRDLIALGYLSIYPYIPLVVLMVLFFSSKDHAHGQDHHHRFWLCNQE